ncbi:MAG: hypothetical protein LBJ61_12090 [Deltaproteobacteria bacterium]|nr:hypothetical protein [Deltaproteobacteria bacterium]
MITTHSYPRYDLEARLLASYFRKHESEITRERRTELLFRFFKDRTIYVPIDSKWNFQNKLVETSAIINIALDYVNEDPEFTNGESLAAHDVVTVIYSDFNLGLNHTVINKYLKTNRTLLLKHMPATTYFYLLSLQQKTIVFFNFKSPYSQIKLSKEDINELSNAFKNAHKNARLLTIDSKPIPFPPPRLSINELLSDPDFEKTLPTPLPREFDRYTANQLIFFWAIIVKRKKYPRWIGNVFLHNFSQNQICYHTTAYIHHNFIRNTAANFNYLRIGQLPTEPYRRDPSKWPILQASDGSYFSVDKDATTAFGLVLRNDVDMKDRGIIGKNIPDEWKDEAFYSDSNDPNDFDMKDHDNIEKNISDERKDEVLFANPCSDDDSDDDNDDEVLFANPCSDDDSDDDSDFAPEKPFEDKKDDEGNYDDNELSTGNSDETGNKGEDNEELTEDDYDKNIDRLGALINGVTNGPGELAAVDETEPATEELPPPMPTEATFATAPNSAPDSNSSADAPIPTTDAVTDAAPSSAPDASSSADAPSPTTDANPSSVDEVANQTTGPEDDKTPSTEPPTEGTETQAVTYPKGPVPPIFPKIPDLPIILDLIAKHHRATVKAKPGKPHRINKQNLTINGEHILIPVSRYNEFVSLYADLEELKRNNYRLINQVNHLQNSVNDGNSDSTSHSERLKAIVNERKAIQLDRQKLLDELAELKRKYSETVSSLEPFKVKIQELEKELEALKAENEEINAKLVDANTLLADFQADPDDIILENLELKHSLELAHNKNKEIQAQLSAKTLALNDANISITEYIRENAILQSDLDNAGEWIYPDNLYDVVKAGKQYYSARLVFHDRVNQSIAAFSQAESEKKYRIIPEAVRMVKALSDTMFKLKFIDGNFSEDNFTNLTGIPFSMTERKTTKREKEIEKSRTCRYKGQDVIFYPHLKASFQGVEFRIHFQFLESERKILICHIGGHLPTAGTRQKS